MNTHFVKAEKCDFQSPSVSFLGFVMQQGKLGPDCSGGMANSFLPSAASTVIGICQPLIWFICDYSKVAAPLTHVTFTIEA